METIKYTSTGVVLGNYWGGGQGVYSAIDLFADTKEELIEKANIALQNGSLDSGMGYESLIGVLLSITKTTSIVKNGKIFTNEELEEEFIGELTDNQADYLEECLYNR